MAIASLIHNMFSNSGSSLTGSVITTTGTGTITTLGQAGYATHTLSPNTYSISGQSSLSTSPLLDQILGEAEDMQVNKVIEYLDRMITMMDMSSIKDDYSLNAIKHLKYAKAFLDKRVLDKINQTIDGKRNPDREEGEDGQLGHR